MLKISPMPSIFGLVVDSYKMTTTGKVVIGATLAQTAYAMWKKSQEAKPQQVSQQNTVAGAISDLMAQLDRFPQVRVMYEKLNQAERMEFIRQQLALKGIKF